MKKRILGIGIFLVAATTFLTSFDEANHEAGSLVVTTTFDGNPIAEALVGIATSEENLENSEYIHEELTDENGVIKFDHLHPGTYYLDADFTTDEISAYAEATVKIGTEEVQLTIVLEDDSDEY